MAGREPDRLKRDQAEPHQQEQEYAAADQPETLPSEPSLSLQNKLSEISRLPGWIRRLALRHSISKDTEFAINVCLEEAVSNVMRHGYGAGKLGEIIVRFARPERHVLEFMVEDEASHFNPLDIPAPNVKAPLRVGGQGVHFLRYFTEKLEYSARPVGNRLRMIFLNGKSEG
jgi:serine/threonine-protein kinase RsbW